MDKTQVNALKTIQGPSMEDIVTTDEDERQEILKGV